MTTQDDKPKGERIAKALARAGLCSRREAERWIAEGRVTVNGAVLTTPAVVVQADDDIRVDGTRVQAKEPTRLWRYHKPAGLVTTHSDPQGRPTVFEALPKEMPRVISIGRLDLNTEGLLLLTNDGELARRLELPATGWVRRYRVRVHGKVEQAKLDELAAGITIEGISYGAIEARLDKVQGTNAWLTVALKEGKNREVRRVLEHLGLRVTRLIRLSYGPFQLGRLERGDVEEVPRRVLRDQLGERERQQKQAEGAATAPAAKKKPRRKPAGPGRPGAATSAKKSGKQGGKKAKGDGGKRDADRRRPS